MNTSSRKTVYEVTKPNSEGVNVTVKLCRYAVTHEALGVLTMLASHSGAVANAPMGEVCLTLFDAAQRDKYVVALVDDTPVAAIVYGDLSVQGMRLVVDNIRVPQGAELDAGSLRWCLYAISPFGFGKETIDAFSDMCKEEGLKSYTVPNFKQTQVSSRVINLTDKK